MKTTALVLAAIVLSAAYACAEIPGLKRDFTYRQGDATVDVLKDDNLVARYVYKNVPKPFFHPVLAPNGEKITRAFPMETVQGEARDHPHQRSFWIGFGDVNGVDFWTEGEKSGEIVQTSIDFNAFSPGYWAIHTKNDWIGPDGKKICDDERYVSFVSCDHGTLISTMLTISASDKPVRFGDTKEGFFAFRVAQGMQVEGGTGRILNSQGEKDKEAWGKRAKWCDYTGKVGDKTCGITIFDAPINHGYPTYWHAQDYGLFSANPFGGATFTRDPQNDSSLTLEPYQSKTFLYVALLHDGALDASFIERLAPQVVGKGPGLPTTEGTDPSGRRPM